MNTSVSCSLTGPKLPQAPELSDTPCESGPWAFVAESGLTYDDATDFQEFRVASLANPRTARKAENMNLIKRALIAVGSSAVAAFALAAPASADAVGPAVSFFKAPIPLVGGTLSDSGTTPSFSIKQGLSISDVDGICAARTDLAKGDPDYTKSNVWNAPSTGRSVTSLIGNTITWTTRVDRWDWLGAYATDCLGNKSNEPYFGADTYAAVASRLGQEGEAFYGRGWSSSACTCFTGGAVMKSSTVGATATYGFSDSPMVSLVSNSATNRGKVSLSVDGGTPVTVSLNGATVNRKILWNSKYLSAKGSHVLTVKVVSGRVDIDGFLTQWAAVSG